MIKKSNYLKIKFSHEQLIVFSMHLNSIIIDNANPLPIDNMQMKNLLLWTLKDLERKIFSKVFLSDRTKPIPLKISEAEKNALLLVNNYYNMPDFILFVQQEISKHL